MNEIKFSCPACGQHIACSTAYCDQAIYCPGCRTEIRVPCSQSSHVPKLKTHSSIPDSGQGSSTTTNDVDKKMAPAVDEKELHCRCPVCQSHLRISATSAAQSAADVFPEAELVVQSLPNGNGPVKPAVAAEAAPTPPTTEREKHIAAERAARDVTLYPKMKPRLDLLMGDGKPKKTTGEDSPDWMKEAA